MIWSADFIHRISWFSLSIKYICYRSTNIFVFSEKWKNLLQTKFHKLYTCFFFSFLVSAWKEIYKNPFIVCMPFSKTSEHIPVNLWHYPGHSVCLFQTMLFTFAIHKLDFLFLQYLYCYRLLTQCFDDCDKYLNTILSLVCLSFAS